MQIKWLKSFFAIVDRLVGGRVVRKGKSVFFIPQVLKKCEIHPLQF